ncbi:N-acetylglutamate synthase-like GNAT family acetyltransferase [Mucilaginibacter gracilis]|uniref:N-acetylglutamate synthase-like GNAT family acetyltransferase n=1 Tax=Mucilaginibacter gracilis TaxID=423350 RepID=A0A495IYA4_9SPHI|nr:GNAT family N-acetyltransferase [Mucilaginibacter gracilis]RKR81680.1 N-acetylglutamate synthase-like GNAT family acetyltransferase [Mucilaginibacter gracilis]
MIIRTATLADVAGIMQLVNNVVPAMLAAGNFQWDSTYPNPAVFETDIELNQLWVAQIDNAIAGVAAITTQQDAEYAQVGWDISETAVVIHRLAVHPQYRGKGIAAALLKQAEQVALSIGTTILRVDTNSNNAATQKLFPKLGYVFAGHISLAFRPGLNFYCYEKRLV